MTEFKFYREDGTYEVVQPEEWQWVAHYLDGTILKQFDEAEERFHQFKEIRQDMLATFAMISITPAEIPPVIIQWAPERKLIHFYRNIRLSVGTPEEQRIKLYCFGWETRGSKVIMVIMPDGGIVITDDVDSIMVS